MKTYRISMVLCAESAVLGKGRRRSGANHCSSPTGPETRPKRIRRDDPWVGCMIMFGMIRRNKMKHTKNYHGIRILTTSPGACPWVTTRRRCRRPSWSSPEGGSFPSWTLRPPQMGRPSFSCLPELGGRTFLFLLLVFVGGVRLRVIER